MSEIADGEPDATIFTDFVYDRNNTEQITWNFCFDATVPISEVAFMSQMIIISNLVSFCIYKFALTQLSCEEPSVCFPYCLV